MDTSRRAGGIQQKAAWWLLATTVAMSEMESLGQVGFWADAHLGPDSVTQAILYYDKNVLQPEISQKTPANSTLWLLEHWINQDSTGARMGHWHCRRRLH